jgi:hypothetical protein
MLAPPILPAAAMLNSRKVRIVAVNFAAIAAEALGGMLPLAQLPRA